MTQDLSDQDVVLRCEGLEQNEVPDGYVLYDAANDRVHYLNPTAAVIYELCDGNRDLAAITAFVQEAYGLAEPPRQEVVECVSNLIAEKVLTASRSSFEA
jgi:hypothetical protein